MGEPMDNLDNVLNACSILTSGWGLSLSPRNVTVSTVGITPGIEKFLAVSRCNLSLSLFSPFPLERKTMIPAEIKYPVKDILELLRTYPVVKNRRLSLAYVMLKDLITYRRFRNQSEPAAISSQRKGSAEIIFA
jgi:23S rRNA (adenine2503-C2)-methyltransferase